MMVVLKAAGRCARHEQLLHPRPMWLRSRPD